MFIAVMVATELVVAASTWRSVGSSPREHLARPKQRTPRCESVSVKLVSRAPTHRQGLFHFPAICRRFRSEPPRTRTWNLEIKSLRSEVSGLSDVPAVSTVSGIGKPNARFPDYQRDRRAGVENGVIPVQTGVENGVRPPCRANCLLLCGTLLVTMSVF
jgi:hypothetical protein